MNGTRSERSADYMWRRLECTALLAMLPRVGSRNLLCSGNLIGRPRMKLTLGFFGACALACWTFPYAAAGADILLVRGHVYTGNPRARWAAAVAVEDARIAAVGTDAAILKRRKARTEVVDLHGQTVIPGIVDSHMHLLYGAYALHGLNLSTPESSITPEKPNELVARLKAYAAEHPQDTVLLARADFSTAPPTTPTAALLDSAVPDR